MHILYTNSNLEKYNSESISPIWIENKPENHT